MKAVIILPARLGSTRLPRKMLADLGGKPLIVRTLERASASRRAAKVVVAADSEEIADVVRAHGGEVVMTSPDCDTGTGRVAEAAAAIDADIFVNIQGDEPEIDPAAIDALIELQEKSGAFASTLATPFPADADPRDPARVKVAPGRALAAVPDAFLAVYFSRAPVPFDRDGELAVRDYFLHLGAYAFSQASLAKFAATRPSFLEKAEKLEQLRILSMGEAIACRLVSHGAPGIDTPADLEAARKRFAATMNQ